MEDFKFLKSGNNNLNFIRLILAISVIFSHAYPLTGYEEIEPLYMFSNEQISIGSLAVNVFFIISGFLITRSFLKDNNARNYLYSRALRIFPGLIVCIIITVFVIGIMATELSLKNYLSNHLTYRYFENIMIIFSNSILPGVFENNIYRGEVNGSIWTLRYEVLYYFFICVLGITGYLSKRMFVMFVYIISLIISEFSFGENISFFRLLTYFTLGMIFYLYKEKVIYKKEYFILLMIIMFSTLYLGNGFDIFFKVFGGYLVFFVAFSNNKFSWIDKYGDYSYGIYIYAFPVQQLITYFFNNDIGPFENFIYSLPITLFMAILSWKYVEKPALNRKYQSRKKHIKKVDFASNS